MQVLLGEQHGDAFLLHAQHGLGHLLDDHRGEALGGLVEQHRLGIAHQRARDGEHLLLAARHGRGAPAPHLGEVREDREQPLRRPGRAAVGRRAAPDLQILVDGEVGEDAPVLRHVAEAEPRDAEGGRPAMSCAVEAHAPPRSADQAHDGLQRGGLAGAVAAHQRDDLAAPQRRASTPNSTCAGP